MAKQEQEVIYTIKIDVGKAERQASDLATNIKTLNTQMSKMKKEGKEGSIQFQQLAATQRDLKGKLRDTNKEIDNYTKVNRKATGSIQEQRNRVIALTKQWKDQETVTARGKKRQAELGAELRKSTDRLKAQESAVGNNTRNVGNYSEAMTDAIGANSGFAGSVIAVGKAFIANPIGAIIAVIVGAVTLLTKAFTRSEKGQLRMAKALGTIGALWDALLKTLEPIAMFLVDTLVKAIEAPEKALESIKQSMIDYVTFLKNNFFGAIENLASIFKNLLAGDFEGAGKAAIAFGDNVTNIIPATAVLKVGMKATSDVASEFADNFDKAAKNVDTLALAEEKLALSESKRRGIELQNLKLAEDQRQIRDDIRLSFEERIIANEKINGILQEQLKLELNLADRAIAIAKARIENEGNSIENQIALQEALNGRLEIMERINGQQSEFRVNEAALEKERIDFAVSESDRKDAEMGKETERGNLFFQVQDQIFQDKLTKQQLEEQAVAKKYEALSQMLTDSQIEGQEARDLEEELIRRQQAEIVKIRKAGSDKISKNRDATRKSQGDADKAALSAGLSSIQSSADSSTGIYKTAAVTQSTMAAYEWAAKAGAADSKLGLVGSIAAYTVALLTGLGAVAQITSLAERGGLFGRKADRGGASHMSIISGPSHAEGGVRFWGEDGTSFTAEGDELIAVVNKHNTKMISTLSDLNAFGGHGDSFAARGGTFLQDGGFASRSIQSQFSEEILANELSQALRAMPSPVVGVEEIIEAIIRVNVVDQAATA